MVSVKLIAIVAAVFLSHVLASDLVSYDIKTQAVCRELYRKPTRKCIWPAGLNAFADQLYYKGRIIAYKIRWFNGKWSGWYVPGINDLDWKFNPKSRVCSALPYRAKTLRRVWSYFYDHVHRFIICKPK